MSNYLEQSSLGPTYAETAKLGLESFGWEVTEDKMNGVLKAFNAKNLRIKYTYYRLDLDRNQAFKNLLEKCNVRMEP